MLKIHSWIADESAWQIVKIKKRRVDLFSYVSSDSDETTSEQIQKRSIRKQEKLSMIESIQRVFSLQSQQQLQITLWQNNLFYEFYSTTSKSH
jgi:predicted ATP-dependent serine protease